MAGTEAKSAPNLRLRTERERRGWSRDYVAEKIGNEPRTVARWERGENAPTPVLRQKLCELFGMDAEQLGFIKSSLSEQEQQNKQIEEPKIVVKIKHFVESASSQGLAVSSPSPTIISPTSVVLEPLHQPYIVRYDVVLIGAILLVVLVFGSSWIVALNTARRMPSHPVTGQSIVLLSPLATQPTQSTHLRDVGGTQTGDRALLTAIQSAYPKVVVDQQLTLMIIARNLGTTTWSAQDGYILVCEQNCMGKTSVDLGNTHVLPGQQALFSVYLNAPHTIGTYQMLWVLKHHDILCGPVLVITLTISVLPGGVWIQPVQGQIVGDELQFSAHAYPTKVGDPLIHHVNFTISASGGWMVACTATPLSGDVFTCTANLPQLGLSPGLLQVSFDVYDRSGNYNLAPHGTHTITYNP